MKLNFFLSLKRILVLFILAISLSSFCISANPILSGQRVIYQDYLKSLKTKTYDENKQQLSLLTAYPLHRYAEYRLLLQFTDTVTPAMLGTFINKEPESAVNPSLIAFFVNKWGKASQFDLIYQLDKQIDLAKKELSTEDKCYLGQTWLNINQSEKAFLLMESIWLTGKSLPDACDGLITNWFAQLTVADKDEALLNRIVLAFEAKNNSLVGYLSKQLSSNYKDFVKGISAYIEKSSDLEPIIGLSVTTHTQQVAITLFDKLTKEDLNKAITLMPELIKFQQLSDVQQRILEDKVFKQLLYLNHPTTYQLKLRDKLFNASVNDELIENRIRIALRQNDWDTVKQGIEKLSTETRYSQTWRYWSAVMMLNGDEKQKSQSQSELKSLASERGFYPMVAAQKLGIDYNIALEPAVLPADAVREDKTIARVNEFLYWNQYGQANREWIYFIERLPHEQQASFARYALEHDWYHLAVQATITGKLWDNLYERFPIAHYDKFLTETTDSSVPKSYALAIARQESAWSHEAMSPAGAMGLMQVMPATAAAVAKKHEIEAFTDAKQLLKPEMNIRIGVQYLEDLLADYGENRILATAGYNAGPNRVKFWLNRTNGTVDSIQFIESISFPETRQYVKNVLSFDLYYRLLLKEKGLIPLASSNILTETEINASY